MTAVRTAPTSAPVTGGTLTGLGTLVRFALRRDRIRLPAWILGITVTMAATAASYPGLYPTDAERAAAAVTIDNPGTTALIGAIYSAEDYTYGAMLGHNTLGIGGVIVALMSILLLVRHTRAEEESGRAELVRSSVVGRHATAAAALIVVVGTNLVLAAALTVGLALLGVESITWAGSLLYGCAMASVGLVFAGVAAVTVQLSEHARTATGAAGLVLAAAFVLRAAGDVGDERLSWLSPIGWAQRTYPYHENRWVPLLLTTTVAAVLVAVAVPLSRRRDVGAGLVPPRPGRATASAGLAGPLGLTLRLHRGTLIGWGIGLLVFGAGYGPVLGEADTFLEDLEILQEFMPDVAGAGGAELFAATIIAVAAIVCAIPAVQVVLRLRTEETAGRAEPLLATALPRVRWVGSAVLVALATGAAMLALFGVSFGSAAASAVDDPALAGKVMTAALGYLPAVAVTVGFAAALFGLLPRATAWAWAPLVFAVVVTYFGRLLDFPDWLVNVSPFAHVPAQPADTFAGEPLLWLSAVALALVVVGLVGIRRRDVPAA